MYTIDCRNTAESILHISLHIAAIDTPVVDLQLPAWRPGRYELAHYAKNMLAVRAQTPGGQPLFVEKTSRNQWRVHPNGHPEITVEWDYYARQMDAGNSWLDNTLVYINFINCLLYVTGREDEPQQVQLQMPETYQTACGLPETAPHTFAAANYQHLADSPLLASATLAHHIYTVDGTIFHLWTHGHELALGTDWQAVLGDFRRFSERQIAAMGSFPESDYHFLLILLPHQQYHGVEHRNSTVMTLGPAEQLADGLYKELVGLASHELFHAWNVCKIRPQELMPYDLTRENYFTTGYVAEGVTTYYGDLFLARSGFFDENAYLAELSQTLNRHFAQSNAARLSLAESSFDLWVDGYTVGVPNRKVSIYHKGALTALILDLEIRQLTQNARSLDDVLRLLWRRFGQTGIGYSHDDYVAAAEETAGRSLRDYFDECITGAAPLQHRLARALAYVGCTLHTEPVAERPGCLTVCITADSENANRRKWLSLRSEVRTQRSEL